jgi:hypothetical protein
MKKLFIKTSLAIVTVIILVTACEKEPIMFDSSKNVLGFNSPEKVISENLGGPSPITIYLGAATGTEATNVTFSVDTVGFGPSGAKEGIDFTIVTNPLSVGVGEATVNITPIDNDVFTGNKKFYLVISSNSKNYRISAQKRVLVTISDDEHPLKSWLGTYTVNAVSYGDPGNWDETWTVTTLSVEGNLNQLSITSLGNGSDVPVIATVDKDALTIEIVSGQETGEAYGGDNGMVKLYFGTDEIITQVLDQVEVTNAMLTAASAIPITGTIEADGTINLDKMGMILTDYDWCWDVFNTKWTKQ